MAWDWLKHIRAGQRLIPANTSWDRSKHCQEAIANQRKGNGLTVVQDRR